MEIVNTTSRLVFSKGVDLDHALQVFQGSSPTGKKKRRLKIGSIEIKETADGKIRFTNCRDKIARELLTEALCKSPAQVKRYFHSITWKTNNVTALIFKNGNVNLIGAKNEEMVKAAGQEIKDKLGFTRDPEIYISNYVGTGKFITEQRLAPLTLVHECFRNCFPRNRFHYETELFPGLVAYVFNSTIIIFSSGKIIITGCKSLKQANLAFRKVGIFLKKVNKHYNESIN